MLTGGYKGVKNNETRYKIMKTNIYNKDDLENTLKSYIRFEILSMDYAAREMEKQCVYCDDQVNREFEVLEKMLGSEDNALSSLNNYSEKNFNKIMNEILKTNLEG